MIVQLTPGSGFSDWREKARKLLQAGVAPEEVLWEEGSEASLFTEAKSAPSIDGAPVPKVPAAFLKLAQTVALHSDARRWSLLYRMLWRMTRQEERNLLEKSTDADVVKAGGYIKAVKREIHKMHAFIRFRKVEGERYVAWFEPDHWIVEAAAPFFRKRFANMEWSIFTPKGCAHWHARELIMTPGVASNPCDHPDELEEHWKTYYRSIFNPARVKIGMMRSEMPERYWKNLPEAELIPELIRESSRRVEQMFDEPEREIREIRGNAYLDRLKETPQPPKEVVSLETLAAAVRTCRQCPLWERATCAVAGEGPSGARIMIVGEQPGDHEDLTGRPFVGPAGQLLDRALQEVGIDRATAYLTNAVKHFKWESRGKQRLHKTPGQREVDACRPWLWAELEQVAPTVLILLGNTAARSLLGGEIKVERDRGVLPSTGLAPKVVLTLHPAALLRLPNRSTQEESYRRWVDDLRLGVDPDTR